MHLPDTLVKTNWLDARREGSCVHAAWSHLLHWQGQHELADQWRDTHSGGVNFNWIEKTSDLAAELDELGIDYAQTIGEFDIAFLQKAIATRRGAAVSVRRGTHMVLLVGLTNDQALIIDVNDPHNLQTWPLRSFLDEWRAAGSWAITPAYTPHAPLPKYP